jgi:ABC-type bacteriocin/lantibiotic exporter with double-glycine peptidase domain
LKLHGLDVSLAETHALAPPGEFGVSLAELETASKSLGFPMTTVRVDDFDDLARFQMPVIAHLGDSREGHFVILLAFDKARSLVLIGDALACDIRWKNVSFLQRGWSGFLLVSERDLFLLRSETYAAVALTFGLVGLAFMAVKHLRITTRTGRGT